LSSVLTSTMATKPSTRTLSQFGLLLCVLAINSVTVSFVLARYPLYTAAGFVGLAVVWLTWRHDELAIVSIPFIAVIVDGVASSGVNLSFVITCLLGIKAIKNLVERRVRLRIEHLVSLFLVGWFALNWILLSGSARGGLPFKPFLAFMQVPLLLVVTLIYRMRVMPLMKSMALTSAATTFFIYAANTAPGKRPVALGLDANWLAATVCLGAVCGAVVLKHTRQYRWLVVVAVSCAGLIPPQSRAALAATAIGFAIVVLAGRGIATPLLMALLLAISVAGQDQVEAFLKAKVVTERNKDEFAVSDGRRSEAIHNAITMILREPFIGIGLGRFPSDKDNTVGVLAITHNEWLGIPAESGIPPLLAIVGLSIWPFIKARKRVMPIIGAPMITLAGLMAKGNYFSTITLGCFFCVLLGIGYTLMREEEENLQRLNRNRGLGRVEPRPLSIAAERVSSS
jgi:O-antigen ligase